MKQGAPVGRLISKLKGGTTITTIEQPKKIKLNNPPANYYSQSPNYNLFLPKSIDKIVAKKDVFQNHNISFFVMIFKSSFYKKISYQDWILRL